jgi:hypothetical protein
MKIISSSSINFKFIFCILILFLFSLNAQNVALDSIKKHLTYLASDICEGRAPGSKGEQLAATYIMQQLSKYQLKPIGDEGSYFQNVPMHGSYPLPETDLKLYSDSTVYSLQLNDDYLLYKSGASTFVPSPLPLVFVGYGIIAPEYDYNDYQDIDVEGKIVVFLSGEPNSNDIDYFKGEYKTVYCSPDSKQRIAISRGASGSIMVLNPLDNQIMDWSYWRRQFQFEDFSLAYTVSGNLSILINPAVAKILFSHEKYTLNNIFEMHRNNRMISFNLASSVSVKSFYKERDFVAKNVIALLEGSDTNLKDSYVLLTAHYDHLGIGPAVNSDSIYNGAFDNAAGVAVLIELARNIVLNKLKAKRSIIFLFTTGEERGLLGAQYYTDHPKKPLYKTIANLNIDGISSFEMTNDFIGIGIEDSDIGKFLNKALSENSVNLNDSPDFFISESESVNRSDHFAFAKAGIPFLIVIEGVNYKNTSMQNGIRRIMDWQNKIYHSPFDDLNQEINYSAVNQHVQILFDLCMLLASNMDPPQWKKDSPFLLRRLQSIAEKR